MLIPLVNTLVNLMYSNNRLSMGSYKIIWRIFLIGYDYFRGVMKYFR